MFSNKRKLDNVRADAATLDLVAARMRQTSPEGPVRGLCNSARNGFEQRHFNQTRDGGLVVVEHTADHGSGC